LYTLSSLPGFPTFCCSVIPTSRNVRIFVVFLFFFGSRCMLELKFVISSITLASLSGVSQKTKSWAGLGMGLPHSRNVYPDTQQSSLVDVSLALGIGTIDSGITLAALAREPTPPIICSTTESTIV